VPLLSRLTGGGGVWIISTCLDSKSCKRPRWYSKGDACEEAVGEGLMRNTTDRANLGCSEGNVQSRRLCGSITPWTNSTNHIFIIINEKKIYSN